MNIALIFIAKNVLENQTFAFYGGFYWEIKKTVRKQFFSDVKVVLLAWIPNLKFKP